MTDERFDKPLEALARRVAQLIGHADPPGDGLMTASQVAAKLGVDRSWVLVEPQIRKGPPPPTHKLLHRGDPARGDHERRVLPHNVFGHQVPDRAASWSFHARR